MKWLEGLLREVNGITELHDSDEEMTGNREIGTLPEDGRRLFSYCMACAVKIKELRKEAREADSKRAERDLNVVLARLEARVEIASRIMWQEIKYAFRDHPDITGCLSICKGFKLCVMDPGKAPEVLFKGMFGA